MTQISIRWGFTRVTSFVSAVALVTGLTVASALPAMAQSPRVEAPVQAETETVPTMIVLDASGSMKTDDAPGRRIDAAKAAVNGLISTLPVGSPIGLQVYGTATGSSDEEKVAGCADIKTLTPVGPLDPVAMTAAVNGIEASGYTPIGAALKAAADALPNEGPRSIVLVSDGEDTCAPPAPCEVAKSLKTSGVDLVVHSVGFKVDQIAREQLTCIADSTGGSYSDATDAAQLETVLTRQVQNALAGYTAQGIPVVGVAQLEPTAPLLTPGQYTDVLALGEAEARPGTAKYYRIPMYPDASPHIAVTTVLPVAEDIEGHQLVGTKVTLVDSDGDLCQEATTDTTQIGGGQHEVPTSTLSWAASRSDCADQDSIYLRVERIGKAYSDKELVIEIAVRIEPPADTAGLPDAAESGPELPAAVLGAATPISGASSFNDAPLLANGATYTDSLSTGESLFYRVQLDWGQRLTYLFQHTGPAVPVQNFGTSVSVTLYNPVRSAVDIGQSAQMFDMEQRSVASSTEYPVRYNNRKSPLKRALSLDGEYFLMVSANSPDLTTVPDATTTISFTTAISGAVDPAPKYQPPGSTAGPSVSGQPDETDSVPDITDKSGPAGSTTANATITNSESASAGGPATSAVSTSNVSGSGQNAQALSANSTDSDPLNILWWMTGGLLLLAILGGGFAIMRNRTVRGRAAAGGNQSSQSQPPPLG